MFAALAVILLTMVGYSSGTVLASRRRSWSPSVIDLLVVAGLWVIMFVWIRPSFGHWQAVGIAFLFGLVDGFLVTTIRNMMAGDKNIIPESELPEHAREVAAQAELSIFQKLWRGWERFGGEMGNVQSRLIMAFFYFIIVTPFGLATRIGTDPLGLKAHNGWVKRPDDDTSLEAASEQG